MIDWAAAAALGVREMLFVAAIGLALSGIDDLFVDAVYLARRARGVLGRRSFPSPAAETMGAVEPGWFAVIVPAWDEASVIGATLRGMTTGWQHPRWRVFVGVYPNDAATRAAVDAVGDPRITTVTTRRDGPTTKADCLNHLWHAVLAHEAAHGIRFKAVVLHDAEDVVDPLELGVFDHLVPRLALVQLPVEPIVDRGSRWVAGHYLDEFAESHAKDVMVREAIGAAVPSAGVACAIERCILGRIADAAGGLPFDPACFTEDYELGLRIKRLGGHGALVRVRATDGRLVACRELFPPDFNAAVRQKSRWMLGIALAGWDRIGWAGGAADRYMLWRDRKPLFTGPLLLIAYAALLGGLAIAAARALWPTLALPPLADDGLIAALLAFNAALLVWRLTLRALFTARAHGWREGARAVPRALVANAVNVAATWRAVRRYTTIAASSGALAWEKTARAGTAAATG